MAKNLLIIESPAKARTIGKYLGPDFRIMASVGHVKDLPVSKLGVDVGKDFQPEYTVIRGKGKVLKELKTAAEKVQNVYLGPDPDREGEAIAWHIAQELGHTKERPIFRVLFNELTAQTIRKAMSEPRELDRNRFESQQARRILDRLVGYQLSPLLWEKVKRGLSAGRVQSVAVKMICDREREIQAFQSEEYWSLTAHLEGREPPPFEARLTHWKGEKTDLKNETQTFAIVEAVEKAPFQVAKIVKKATRRNPPPPFTTSLLQQEAHRRLRFTAKRTMGVAQSLYEGVDLGKQGVEGLITYMRTDSFRLSGEALDQVRGFIHKTFGDAYLPDKARSFKSRKGAQEAHEAIRPTSTERTPEAVAPFLSKEQLALYELIWKRFVACQMNPAILDRTEVDIQAGPALFRATGSIMVFPGFTILYQEPEAEGSNDQDQEARLPPLQQGQDLHLQKLDPDQHFTQPPPRYTEATLIKALEENGIGRPSTYATILSNINGREYVTLEKGRFIPSELGMLVTDLLVKNFPRVLNTAFTAQMESDLDLIERGEVKWTDLLRGFYQTFEQDLVRAKKDMRGEVPTDVPCPNCGKPLVIKSGRNGIFLGCQAYPACKYTTNFSRDEKGAIVPVQSSHAEPGPSVGTCEKCGKPMVLKKNKFGKTFTACSGYPTCKNIWPEAPASTGVGCPNEGCTGTLVERTSKTGKRFYACNAYPQCQFVAWDEPVDGSCPQCGTRVLVIKKSKKGDAQKVCRNRKCGFTTPIEPA